MSTRWKTEMMVENIVENTNWQGSASHLIESFKEAFDLLANLSKLSENGFIQLYKKVRSLKSPNTLLENGIHIIQKINEEKLKNDDDENVDKALTLKSSSSLSTSSSPSKRSLLQLTAEEREQEIKERVAQEVAVMKENMEISMRNNVEHLRSNNEQQLLDLEKTYTHSLNRKDEELRHALNNLEELKLQSNATITNQGELSLEMERRRGSENKCQVLEQQNLHLNSRINIVQDEYESVKRRAETAEKSSVSYMETSEKEKKLYKTTICET